MEKGWNIRLLAERFSVMEKIPMSDEMEFLFSESDNPKITIDDLSDLVKWS